jgi:hypothetical protein
VQSVTRIYVPTRGADDWRWLLAKPGLHWKQDASAKALADAWENADDWPEPVASSLATSPDLTDLKLLLAIPEHQTPLPGGNRASQTDLLVLARSPTGDLVAIAVEGKAQEPFGDTNVAEWRASNSPGRADRLRHLLSTLELPDDDRLAQIRYQLLHRTAAAIMEARRFGASHAVMLVHSFSTPNPESRRDAWFEDFAAFAALYGVSATKGSIVRAGRLGDVTLHLGWVSDVPRLPDPRAAGVVLGARFDHAVALTRQLHACQLRKGTEIPYVSHLLGVASLVLEDGGDEDEAIAALLHDAVEDQGGEGALKQIEQLFGTHVAAIVQACSDTDVTPKPPWRQRKEAYIAHLRDPPLPAGTVRVSLADKLHNARAILFDLRAGHDVFARFSADRSQQAWYYSALVDTFAELTESPMVPELRRVVRDLFDDHQEATAIVAPSSTSRR